MSGKLNGEVINSVKWSDLESRISNDEFMQAIDRYILDVEGSMDEFRQIFRLHHGSNPPPKLPAKMDVCTAAYGVSMKLDTAAIDLSMRLNKIMKLKSDLRPLFSIHRL